LTYEAVTTNPDEGFGQSNLCWVLVGDPLPWFKTFIDSEMFQSDPQTEANRYESVKWWSAEEERCFYQANGLNLLYLKLRASCSCR